MAQPTVSPGADYVTAELGAERRTAVRYPSDLQTTCQPIMARDGSGWSAQVRNISTGGLGLVLARRFERGTLLVMDLDSTTQTASRTLIARVVHSTPLDDGNWLLGCAFANELEDEDLQPFCARRERPAAPDCRAWVRFACDLDTSCQPAQSAEGEPWAVKVVNIAPGGVGLLTPVAVQTGVVLQLELPGSADRPGRSLPVRVIQSTKQAEEDWLVGCAFVGELTEEDLQALLG
jgi:hypothetical protein